MKNAGKRLLIFSLAAMVCALLGGCGAKGEPEKESTEVLKLTITPEATPTPAPEQVDARIVEKNGSLMTINEYLLKNPGEIGKSGPETGEADGESGGDYGYDSGEDYSGDYDYDSEEDYSGDYGYDSGEDYSGDYDYDSGGDYSGDYDYDSGEDYGYDSGDDYSYEEDYSYEDEYNGE